MDAVLAWDREGRNCPSTTTKRFGLSATSLSVLLPDRNNSRGAPEFGLVPLGMGAQTKFPTALGVIVRVMIAVRLVRLGMGLDFRSNDEIPVMFV
jgi:hypothetical protein